MRGDPQLMTLQLVDEAHVEVLHTSIQARQEHIWLYIQKPLQWCFITESYIMSMTLANHSSRKVCVGVLMKIFV